MSEAATTWTDGWKRLKGLDRLRNGDDDNVMMTMEKTMNIEHAVALAGGEGRWGNCQCKQVAT